MTKPIDLWLGARVEFWRTFPMGKGFFNTIGNLKRQASRQVPGTVVSLNPLRVLWDFTYKRPDGSDGPATEYPLGDPTKEGYDRSCIRLLPGQHPRHCSNCYYSTQIEGFACPEGDGRTCMNIPGPRSLHKWRWEHDPTVRA